jgi:4-amino-4-deoxy-L-arabinose transferase-like glycosyltransferase
MRSRVPTAPAVADRVPGFTPGQLGILLGITLVAAGLRLWRIEQWSFWVDEAHTFRDATRSMDSFWDAHVHRYPIGYLLLRSMLSILPSSGEGALRLPFAFFGIITIPALALMGRAIVGRGPALVAAAFLAVSPWHLYWSQNCRAYALVIFWSLLAVGAFYRALAFRSLRMVLVTLAVTLFAGLCHPSSYVLLAAYFVYGVVARFGSWGSEKADRVAGPMDRWWPWIVLGVIGVLLPLMIPAVNFFRSAKPDVSLLHLAQTTVYFVRIPLLVSAVGGLLWLVYKRERAALFLACWALAPLVVLAVVASTVFKVTAQYAVYTLPAFCLLAGCATQGLVEHVRGRGVVAWALRVVPLSIVLFEMLAYDVLYFTKQHGDRPNWRAAARWVEHEPAPKKRILTTNGPSLLYYLDPLRLASSNQSDLVVPLVPWDLQGRPVEYLNDAMAAARDSGTTLYAVLTEPELEEMDPSGRFDAALRRHFHQVKRYPVWTGPKDMTVLVYVLSPPPSEESTRR